ncbi:polymorphic toxin-type HINT domain-containing protein [Streptomyces sp900129855]|uniref:Polymorphic toxin-type HINT domain-containing protein n=1 Tax=Streptomyces sp. 900129855 TaxID=3155129 RepID=A0ABV2ZE81_9ACTN
MRPERPRFLRLLRLRTPRRKLALATATVMTATLLQGVAAPALADGWHKPALPAAEKSLAGGPAGKAVPRKVMKTPRTPQEAPATAWPKPGAATVDLSKTPATAPTKPAPRVKGLALTLDAQVTDTNATKAGKAGKNTKSGKATKKAATGTVAARVLDRAFAKKAGVDGPVFTLHAGSAQGAGQVRAGLDYSSFAGAYGGGYADRLRLVELPACVLSTPQQARCRTAKPVDTVNDPETKTLTAKAVTLSASSATVLAAVAGSGSGLGDFKATSLSASANWSTDLNSGSFAWSYPMAVPQVPGGLAPKLSLSYSSGGVDGRTGNTNNQSSWVGDGFDLSPGYIERRYKSCSDDDVKNADGNEPGDLCWGYDNAVLQLNGSGGELVPNGTNSWKLKDDDGTQVDRVYGSSSDVRSNGARNDEYWRVTTPDGTQYYFGYNRLPGWASGSETTDSAWTVPVYGDDSGEPCHAAAFADSWCQQGWRWNLDYVVDTHGNAVAYYYDKESNSYGRNLKAADDTPYVRGGTLDRIEYGLKSTAVYSAKPLAKVDFTSSERCLPDSSTDCSSISKDAFYWYDTPWDLNCDAGTDCDKGRSSPAFFTRKRLTDVTTEVLVSGAYSKVDGYQLAHRWGQADIDYQLLLDSVQRTGYDGTASITLPKVTFAYTQLANRLDKTGDGWAPFIKARLSSVADESGGQIDVDYSAPVCDANALPTPETNTTRCFPQYIGGSSTTDPERQWFNKYVVDTVTSTDRTGGAPDQVTMYDYLDGAAWHYDDADGMTKDKFKTWSDWRGYGHVRVRTGGQGGASAMKSQTDSYFLRGMDGDRKTTSGGTKDVSVTLGSGEGDPITDHSSTAGFAYKTVNYSGPGGKVLSKTVSRPWHKETAKKVRDWGTVTADFSGTENARTWTSLDDGAGAAWRTTSTTDTFDPATGQVTQTDDAGDTSTAADDQCTRTTYVAGSAVLNTPVRVETVAKACGAATSRPADVLTDTRTAYDGGAYGAAATKGDATRVAKLKKYDGSTAVYLESSSTFDSYGRMLTSTDLTADVAVTSGGTLTRTARTDGRTTTTAFTPTSGFATGTTVTMPPVTPGDASTATTTSQTFEALRGQPLTETDTNGKVTTYAYDPLGRNTKVWLPDRTTGQTPSYEFTYTIADGKPVAIGTRTIGNNGAQNTSYVLYDGFLRPRQTQAPGPNGGTLLTDTFYDERGLTAKEFAPYYTDTTAPSTTLFKVDDALTVETQSWHAHDGLGRETELKKVAGNGDGGTVLGVTKTIYGGDRTTVIPPAGGTATTTLTDSRGQNTEVRELHARAADAAYDTTSYGYSPRGELTKVTDPAGNAWTWTYDLLGRLTDTTDPDKGAGHTDYDDRGLATTTKDARGSVLAHVYDGQGRPTELRENSATGTLRAKWVYDTISGAKGHLAESIRYSGGQAYSTKVLAYDRLYRPLRTQVTIPSTEGALAGTYLSATTYNASGTVDGVGYPKAGALAANTVAYTYEDGTLRPVGVSGPLNLTGSTSYSFTGKPLQYSLAANGGKTTYETNTYEWGTQRLATSRVDRQDVAGVDQYNTYTYDEAGNVLSVSDTSRSGTDNQCFAYDYLGRTTEAWTQPTTACASAPATGVLGGPAPYWDSYTYDVVGNRLTETGHGTTTGASDSKRVYTYPKPGSHRLSSVDTTTGTVKSTDSYTYDAIGDTQTRQLGDGTSQTLLWDAEGHLAKVTEPVEGGSDKVTEYLYDADGNRLIGRTPTGTTLYLGTTEVTLAKGATTAKATRYFDLGGGHQAVQSDDGRISFTLADHHGTGQLSVDATSQALAQRRTKPFGGLRGAEPATWPGTRGFVGGTVDAATGLTHLGAREYDPATGRFLSVDPLFTATDPQQMHGYTYANNNPLTHSDPAGTEIGSRPNSCQYDVKYCSRHQQQEVGYDPKTGTSDYHRGNIYKRQQARKRAWVASNTPVTNDMAKLSDYFSRSMIGEFSDDFWDNPVYEGAEKGSACYGREGCRQAYKYILDKGDDADPAVAKEIAATYCAYHADQCDDEAKEVARGKVIEGIIGDVLLAYLGGAAGAERPRPCNSFLPGTEVLMADGTAKPIEDVRTGDKVLATDPRTGRTTVRTVTAEITGKGLKHLVGITLALEVDGKRVTASVTATDGHPFWVPALGKWIKATDLTAGELLRTSRGTEVRITAVRRWTEQATVHNVTVADLHTYYVLAGKTPVLVHNATPCDPPLKSLHPDSSLDRSSLDFWHKQDTKDIVHSLRPGAHEPLIAKPDGTIMNGNTRIAVLRSRGYDVDSLPRETYGSSRPMSDEDFWDMDQ